ncbi:Hypothetical protein PENO1_097830 [Penicillium occitanis (nom. inval.)]|nr:Hypothetical protein PENO1_097830 [Penicillium occitanis (nom. inval.)]
MSQFDKTGQKLARSIREYNGTELYLFRGLTSRPPKLHRKGALSRPLHDPHIPEPDRIPDTSCINPALLHKQSEPLSEGLLSHDLDDRLERSTLGDLGQNWNNTSLPSTDTTWNLADNGNPDTSSSNARGIATISPLTPFETADHSTPRINKVATRANMQASVEDVSDEVDNIIPQTERASPTGCDENMQPSLEDVNDGGDDIIPRNKRARPTGNGDHHQAGSRKSRKKDRSKKSRETTHAQSTVQRKSKGLVAQTLSNQQTDNPPSMTRYSAYDQMRCLFGPDKEKKLSESKIAKILALYAKSSRPDLATFLENLSDLWRTNRFWSPDALHLSMLQELPLGSSCLRLFRYDGDLGKETGINVIRRCAKVDLIELEAFITYVLNTQPRVVALCHKYEQPVKDLLNGKKPALTLTEKEVTSTIGGLPHAIDHNEGAENPWQRINTKIDTDVFEVLSHD